MGKLDERPVDGAGQGGGTPRGAQRRSLTGQQGVDPRAPGANPGPSLGSVASMAAVGEGEQIVEAVDAANVDAAHVAEGSMA